MHPQGALERLECGVPVAAQQFNLPEAAQSPEMPGLQLESPIHVLDRQGQIAYPKIDSGPLVPGFRVVRGFLDKT